MKKIKSLFTWFAGFFQDKDQQASRKAAALYVSLWFLYIQIDASAKGILENNTINRDVFWGTIALVLFCVGAITSETIAKIFDNKMGIKSTTESESSSSSKTTTE